MRVLNLNAFKQKQHTVFILSYLGIEYFMQWFTKIQNLTNTQFVIVDNGQQVRTEEIKDIPVYQTSQTV